MTLQTSFRSVPAIQHFVNAAFHDDMDGDRDVAAGGLRSAASSSRGCAGAAGDRGAAGAASVRQEPIRPAAGDPDGAQRSRSRRRSRRSSAGCCRRNAHGRSADRCASRRKIVASDVCLLFRRFLHFGKDITRDYVEALEARGIPHLLVGGKTFHEREEVDAIRTALTAIEWPEDELSVYAALHGPLFAIGEEELLEYHSIARAFHPYRVPTELPERLQPVAQGARARCASCTPPGIIVRSPTRSAA